MCYAHSSCLKTGSVCQTFCLFFHSPPKYKHNNVQNNFINARIYNCVKQGSLTAARTPQIVRGLLHYIMKKEVKACFLNDHEARYKTRLLDARCHAMITNKVDTYQVSILKMLL